MIWPELMMGADVKKIDKRLWIVEQETGYKYYTPPDFIRDKMNSRQPMIELAERMNQTPYNKWFDLVFEFESNFRR